MLDSKENFRIRFLGATETVTGSRYLLESDRTRVLVDCGLFQGYKKLRQRNWAEPGFEPASVQAVILTHAHLDHSGYLPRLVKAGYAGPVYCTPGTRDLLHILLPDAGHLQEEEARLASRFGFAHHAPPLPLFTREDALRCLEQLRVVDYRTNFEVTEEVRGSFTRAGHIVGSACLRLELGKTSIAFSGDVGRQQDPIMSPPERLSAADYLVVESTYGDRRHPTEPPGPELGRIVEETVARGGTLVIPAFAVGRAQHVLHLLAGLRRTNELANVPIFLDSPMAIDATEIFRQHAEEHRLTGDECREMCRLARYSRTADDSKAIDAASGPMIIISASGMATGGRVLHHLKRFLPDERSAVLLVGYQSAGTRGRSLLDGAEELKIHGQYVPVRAKVHKLDALSAHADYAEIIAWLKRCSLSPARTFVTHGEPAAADAMRRRLRDELGWDAVVPDHDSSWTLPRR
jgi:metallo-beta-lactamase family protein